MDRNYDSVNIQKWIFRISADDLVPRFISFNDFQWISTAKFVWKRQIFEYFEFFLTKDYWDRMSSQYVTCHKSRHYSCHTTIQSHNKILMNRKNVCVYIGGASELTFIMPNYPLLGRIYLLSLYKIIFYINFYLFWYEKRIYSKWTIILKNSNSANSWVGMKIHFQWSLRGLFLVT